MSLAMIQRLVVSSCRGKVNVDACRGIVLSLSATRGWTTVTETRFPRRSFYDSAIRSERINPPRKNGCGVLDNLSTLQIKKRSSRRNTGVLNDKTPKPNVSPKSYKFVRRVRIIV